ncbi:acetyl-coenzyme A synthetase, chloroplastic/glyoxysomal-like [Dorcoceras hygrometricum]|nr:acetyl-coenzyme A synthetase, chloroplastic/glyoxysomal-like [Dorcoceras hygrometricum]
MAGRGRTRRSIPLEETHSDNNSNITQLLRLLVEQNNKGNGQSSSSRGPSNDDPQEKFRLLGNRVDPDHASRPGSGRTKNGPGDDQYNSIIKQAMTFIGGLIDYLAGNSCLDPTSFARKPALHGSRTPQNLLPLLKTLSSVSLRESRIQYLCDPQWFRNTASRGPTTIVASESQFRIFPSDHDSIGYPRMSASGESSTTMHRLLHASGSHPIPPLDDPNTTKTSGVSPNPAA